MSANEGLHRQQAGTHTPTPILSDDYTSKNISQLKAYSFWLRVAWFLSPKFRQPNLHIMQTMQKVE